VLNCRQDWTDESVLVLEHETMRLVFAPHEGGAIRELKWRGRDLLRPTPPGAGADPFATACFPMVPFANRVAHGRFTFRGRTVELERNWREDPHPLHGQGWRAPWSVMAVSPSSVTVGFDGGADEWPWRYACEQRFRLLESGLEIELSIENLSVTPMPVMLGLHPYFPDAPRAQIIAHLPRVWLTDNAALPVLEAQTPPAWSFDAGRHVGAVPLDHCFAEWNGSASLHWPDLTLNVRATSCSFLHIYAPSGRDFFCLEPLSAPVGALGREAEGATVVTPGGRFAIAVQFIARAN
jgi:aldose 1-epimerase